MQKAAHRELLSVSVCGSGRMLVTASADGCVWFFSLLLEQGRFAVAPLGFAQFGQPAETVTGLEFVPGSEVCGWRHRAERVKHGHTGKHEVVL